MAHIDELAARRERDKADAFSAEAKLLTDIANHLNAEAREHAREAELLLGRRTTQSDEKAIDRQLTPETGRR